MVHKDVSSRNIAADHTRHGASGTRKRYRPSGMEGAHSTHKAVCQSRQDATTLSAAAGNGSSEHNRDATLRTKGCVIGHRAFVPRMRSPTQNIELGPGPAQLYNMKSPIHARNQFGQQLLRLTQTVEALVETFLQEGYSKYTAVYATIYHGKADNVDRAFGIWTSRSRVINSNSNNHKDLEDVCYGWCAIVVS